MRGKVVIEEHSALDVRITPAYAGKRTARSGGSFCLWDHPRLCGEKGNSWLNDDHETRITPAYAGKREIL